MSSLNGEEFQLVYISGKWAESSAILSGTPESQNCKCQSQHQHERVGTMALQFIGTRVELKAWLVDLGVRGSWELQPNQVFMLRCRDGANVHWAQRAKTLWFSGKAEAQERLARRLEAALMQRDELNALENPGCVH